MALTRLVPSGVKAVIVSDVSFKATSFATAFKVCG
jgi:hypothetical protein